MCRTSTLASRLGAVLHLVAGAMAVEAGVIAVHLAFAAGTTSLLSLPATATVVALSLGLLLPPATRSATGFLGQAHRAGVVPFLLLLRHEPLLLSEHELPTDGDGLEHRLLFQIIHRLQSPGHLLNGEVLEVDKSLDGDLELGVLLRNGAKKLLHRPLLVEVLVTVEGHLLLQCG
jgi:hypothetical protein